jgi:hypothetical protein
MMNKVIVLILFMTPMCFGLQDEPSRPLKEEQLPKSGVMQVLTEKEQIAPFKINADSSSNYLVKLVDVETRKDAEIIFLRSGESVTVDVPLGKYEVRYASGEKWYGLENYFGPMTDYNKADQLFSFTIIGNQVSGYEITLYKVVNGNLPTIHIRSKDF